MQAQNYNYIIAGAGIIGMTVAFELKKRFPDAKIAIFEKEQEVALHASGRNSGVLHAGFYYTKDSLKARFTVDGNKRMKEFCTQEGVFVNACQKLVVARNQSEVSGIEELKKRGDNNGVQVEIITEEQAREIDPNVKTFQKALYSPTTASVDPVEVCLKLKKKLQSMKIDFYFNSKICNMGNENTFVVGKQKYACDYLINAAGLYADKIARDSGASKNYTILPFKGLYLKYKGNSDILRTNVYPVPNLLNPFLGVHFTKTADGSVKIGPTSVPAFWRENYVGFKNFKPLEAIPVLLCEAKLFLLNSFNFRKLAFEEIRKYSRAYLLNTAQELVHQKLDNNFQVLPAGIRAQLLNKKTNELVMDFVLEHTKKATHILNAVSPAFTCAFSFAEYVVEEILKNRSNNE